VHQVRRLLKRRNRRWDEPFTPPASVGQIEEFEYDEFE